MRILIKVRTGLCYKNLQMCFANGYQEVPFAQCVLLHEMNKLIVIVLIVFTKNRIQLKCDAVVSCTLNVLNPSIL